MPRIGMNPSRGKKLNFVPARVTACVLTFVPHQAGFFEQRMSTARMTIESIIANTGIPCNLLVFDNGSCPEMVNYLKSLLDSNRIDFLMLSRHNIGKLNALRAMFQAAPGEVIAYADDDIYHLPGWLQAHLEVLDAFPHVGAVTGFYVRQRAKLSSSFTVQWASEGRHTLEKGLLIPRKWEDEYIDAYDRTTERYQAETEGIEDILVKFNKVEAWVGAHHFQMVTPKAVILPIIDEMLPTGWNDGMMGRMVEMDDLMDAKGYLRLTTREQVIRLMGNTITSEISDLAKTHGLEVNSVKVNEGPSGLTRRIVNNKLIRKTMQAVINKFHHLLNLK